MFKMIGGDGREYGPVSVEQLREWIADNRANGQTMVQPEGATDWRPLASFPEFAEVLQTASAPPAPAPAADAAAAVEKEPVPTAAFGTGALDVGASLGHGWLLMGRHAGLLLGATTLVWLLTTLPDFVPLLGPIFSYVISGPLYGGLFLVFLRALRGEENRIGDIFGCFGASFVPLMLVWIVTDLLSKLGMACCLIIPGVLLKIFWAFALVLVADRKLDFGSALGTSWRAVGRQFLPVAALLFVTWLPMIVFTGYSVFEINRYLLEVMGPLTSARFEQPLATLTEMMREFSKPEHVQFFVKLQWEQQLVLLLNLPFAVAALMHAYETIFGEHSSEAH